MLTDAKVEFGVIPQEHWKQPDWVDEPTAEAWRDWMVGEGVIYAGEFKSDLQEAFSGRLLTRDPESVA